MEGPLLSESEHTVDMTADEDYETFGPCTEDNVLIFIDFVVILVQIVAAIVVLIRAKDEHPPATLFSWIIMYTCLCIATLPILYWRFWEYIPSSSYRRYKLCFLFPCFQALETKSIMVLLVSSINTVVDLLKKMLGYLFVNLFVLFLCVFIGCSLSLHDDYTQHFWCATFKILQLFPKNITHVSNSQYSPITIVFLQVMYGFPCFQFHSICAF